MLNSEDCQKLTRRQKSRQNLAWNKSRQKQDLSKTNLVKNESCQIKLCQKHFPSKTNPVKKSVKTISRQKRILSKSNFATNPVKNSSKRFPVKNESLHSIILQQPNPVKTSVRKTRQKRFFNEINEIKYWKNNFFQVHSKRSELG